MTPKINDFKLNYDKSLVLICIILYLFIFVVLEYTDKFNSFHQYCFGFCNKKNNTCYKLNNLRDSNYYSPNNNNSKHPLEIKGKQGKICYFTFWELTHFIFHIYIGYWYGFLTSMVFSIGFEIFEHYYFNCGSVLDLGYNGLGMVLGILLRKKGY